MTQDEEMALRQLAAGGLTIQKVVDLLGPMSLWSKDGLEAEIRKAVLAERDACAELCVKLAIGGAVAADCARVIRAREA